MTSTGRMKGAGWHDARRRGTARAVACLAVAVAGADAASADETFEQALRASDFIVDMRLRYEGVELALGWRSQRGLILGGNDGPMERGKQARQRGGRASALRQRRARHQ